MLALKMFRDKAAGVADLLNWSHLLDSGIVLDKDGSLLAGWFYRATDCGFPALPGLRARLIRRRLRNCRGEATALSRERDFYRSAGVRNHGANRAVKIRHWMPGLR
jgi:hypothetical protein